MTFWQSVLANAVGGFVALVAIMLLKYMLVGKIL